MRDIGVTGVQTCALPISADHSLQNEGYVSFPVGVDTVDVGILPAADGVAEGNETLVRSEERRVGKSVDLGGRRMIKKKYDTNHLLLDTALIFLRLSG